MCSIALFPPPPPSGYVTLCERNGQLVAAHAQDTSASIGVSMQNLDYPEINVCQDLLKPSLSKETARSAFLEHNDTLRKRLLLAWHEHGLSGILEELAQVEQKDKAAWVSTWAGKVLGLVRWAMALHGSLFPHLAMSNEDLIAEFSTNFNWKESPVRCFAWHPHTGKFALASRDDCVRVYMASRQDVIVPILKHKLQKSVAALAWKPESASVLAVACHTCVLIWHVDPTSLATRPSTSSVQVLSQSGHMPITSITWSPTGGVLVSASPTDTAMMVWDVAMESCIPLRRIGGGGVSLLQWSPDGSKLFAACPSPVFRVWECRKWSCEKWSKLLSRCKCACWSPDGSTLLFATATEPIIYSLTFNKAVRERHAAIGGSKVAVTCVDLSEVEMQTEDGTVRVGGLVQSMCWDPNGERLAVQFKGCSSDLIALFQTSVNPMLEVMPCGFVRGLPGDVPHLMAFQPRSDHGSLLTVVWSSGRLSFLPLYYMAQQEVEERRFLDPQSVNGHLSSSLLMSEGVH